MLLKDPNKNPQHRLSPQIEKPGTITFSKSTSISSNLTTGTNLKIQQQSTQQLQLIQRKRIGGGLVKSSSSPNNHIACSTNTNTNNTTTNNNNTNHKNASSNSNHEQMRLIKESKAAKTLAIVVGGFVVSWMPFFIVYVLEAILPRGYISKMLFDWLTWLGYFNSAINPIIYAFYSKQFRSAFYRLTLGKFSSKSNANKKLFTNHSKHFYYSVKHVNGNI